MMVIIALPNGIGSTMATAQTTRMTALIARLTRGGDAEPSSDGDLLDDYVRDRDASAFETLVRRHGPMVLAVCRRVLGCEQDAEDAFQATFLVLVHRADAVRPRDRVGNWLYGVAIRTALKARTGAVTRRVKERAAARTESTGCTMPTEARDWAAILDEELCRLAEKYREPIVLCDLRGLTRTEAARVLGWPEGSVAGRLARARALLAERLRRRGVTPSVAAVTALLAGGHASAGIPHSLLTRTVHLSAAVVPAAAGATVSTRVASLANEVLTAMTATNLKTVVLGAVFALSLGLGTAAVGLAGWGPTTDPVPARVNTDPAPEPAGAGHPDQPPKAAETPRKDEPKARTLDLNKMWSRGRAVGKGPLRFTHPPMRPEDIDKVLPYGLMVGGHVMPIDHGYFYPKDLKSDQPHFDVFAPADGFIVLVGHRVKLTGSTEKAREYDDYALTIEHSATFYTQYDLLTALSPAVLKQLDAAVLKRFQDKQQGPTVNVRIAVKAGDVIGTVGGRSLDFGVVNSEQTLKGLLSPELYGHYGWRVHLADPYAYFDEPLRGKLLKLNPRTAEPRCGKFDYDVDGKAVGNWFKEGTGGYAGNRDKRGYWMGHLALVYHAIDPSLVIVSVGDFDGRPRQLAVVGNGPDPAKVSAKDGVVKYELQYAPLNSGGEKIELPRELRGVQGVLLIEVLDGRKLKAEAFPGKTAKDVTGFTIAAAVYER